MHFGSGLTLITVGALLIFAVRREPSVLDLDAVGLILIVVGGIDMTVNHYVWKRRKQAADLPLHLGARSSRRPVPAGWSARVPEP